MSSPVMIIDNHKSKPKLPRSPLRRRIGPASNTNGTRKSPGQEPTLPFEGHSWPISTNGSPLAPQITHTHQYEATSMSFSNNFEVPRPQGQTMRSHPPTIRVIPDSGPMCGGIQISIYCEDFGLSPQPTCAVAFGDQVTLFTVYRPSAPSTVASGNNIPMNHGMEAFLIGILPPISLPGFVAVTFTRPSATGLEAHRRSSIRFLYMEKSMNSFHLYPNFGIPTL